MMPPVLLIEDEPIEVRGVHCPTSDGGSVPLCWYSDQRATGLAHDDAVRAALIGHVGEHFQVALSAFLFGELLPAGQCPACLEWRHG